MSKPIVRCSGLDQLLNCPGSPRIIAMAPPREDGEESNEGSMGHWLIANQLIHEQGAVPANGELEPPSVTEGYEMPRKSLWMIDWCVRSLMDFIPMSWAMAVEDAYAHDFGDFILSGHIDVMAISPDGTEAAINDWKLGYLGQAPADESWQLLGYIVLVKLAYPSVTKITARLTPPRAFVETEDRISEVTVEGAMLDTLADFLAGKVREALADSWTLSTGPRQCRWCPAKTICPAIRELAKNMKLKLTPEFLAELPTAAPEEVAALVADAKVIEGAANEAASQLKDMLNRVKSITMKDGTTVTLHSRNGQYSVRDPHGVYATLTGTFTPEEVAEMIKPRCAAIREALGKKLGLPMKSKKQRDSEQAFDETFGPYLERGTTQILKWS